MPTYILGRDQVATAPGVLNDNIKRVSLKVAGSELDVTVFKTTPLTQIETMVGLVDVTFEIVATATTATIGQAGAFDIGKTDGATLQAQAVVTDVRMNVTPKGMKEFTVSYAIKQASGGGGGGA